MNQINEPGNPKSFGHEFNYSVWTANNVFTLCNVPWNSDYRDVAGFRTTAEFNDYIDNTPSTTRVSITGTRAKLNMPVRVGMTLAKAMKYNYIRIKNGLQPVETGDEPQTFYYFIVGMREINPETTELLLQLDVWASFSPLITGCRGFIERGHIGMANSKRMQNNGRDYLSIPEGFDTGAEYVGIAARSKHVARIGGEFSVCVLVVFASDPDAPAYKDVGGTQVPNYTTAKGDTFQGLPSGAAIRIWSSPEMFMGWVASNSETPWKTQSILSITIIPDIRSYFQGWPSQGSQKNGYRPPTQSPRESTFSLWQEWRQSILDSIPAKYRKLDKFKTSPYMKLELTALTGTPVELAPESWNNSNADISSRVNFLPPNARMQFRPDNYNAQNAPNLGTGDQLWNDDAGTFWDLFTQIGNFPTIPIMNDQAVLALANQSGSMAYAHRSADWAQQKSLAGAQTGYDQASSAMQLGSDQLGIEQAGAAAQNRIQQDSMRNQALIGLAGGVGQGAGMGAFAGPAGAVAGAAGSALSGAGNTAAMMAQMGTMNEQLTQNWETQNAQNARQNQFGSYIRDSNADLARFAAKGDYENSLAAIKARVQDTMMMPASVVGQLGGEALALINSAFGVSLRWKFIDAARMREIGDHWLRYGYAVQQYATIPATFKVMDRFTYWKMSETYLSGARIPENFRQALRGIFEKGFTAWNNPDDISDTNFDISDNNILTGITLP